MITTARHNTLSNRLNIRILVVYNNSLNVNQLDISNLHHKACTQHLSTCRSKVGCRKEVLEDSLP